MTERTRLFVYGTLRPGRAPAGLVAVVAALRVVAAARMPGRLYDLGPYPGAVRDATAPGVVHGDVVELSNSAPPLAWFDAYEGIDPAKPVDLYAREWVEVETDRGAIACWAYLLRRVPSHAAPIASGEWPGAAA